MSQSESSEKSEKVVLDIEGMSCGHCVGRVKDALSAVDGVASADVSLDPGSATVKGENLVAETLAKIVSDVGYEASVQA